HAIWRKLLAMSAEVGRREPQFLSKFVPADHRPNDAIRSAQHRRRFVEIAGFNRISDRGAADDVSIYHHWRDADDLEVMSYSQLLQQSQIAGAVSSEGPLVADTDFAQRLRIRCQLPHELLRRGGGEG